MSQKRYAYLIGANGPQTERLTRLQYAQRDAQRLAEALQAPHCAFTQAEAIVAESPQPTLAGLNRFVKQCEPSDLLLVHFSGHADRGRGGQLILLCNGTDIDDYTSSAIKISSIKEYLDECKARQKVLILDCCHAGAAHTSPFKGDQGLRSSLQQTLGESANLILSACSSRDRTRELGTLDGGAGFLSWTFMAACTSRFEEISQDKYSLSLMDIWKWIPIALQEVNDQLGPNERLPHPILLNEMIAGHDGEIWLTEQQRADTHQVVLHEVIRKKYLENVSKRYSSVALPLGPTESFSLHAVFQPLELRRDPLAAEDLERNKRRLLLGERPENGKGSDHFRSQQNKRASADEKQQPVIAENGEDLLIKSPQRRVVILGGPGTGKTTMLKYIAGYRAKEALTDSDAPLPIFLSLADLARSQKTLQSYLVDLVEELGIERCYAETLWKAIDTGQAFVCLDSLDEVKPQHRQKMIELVNARAAESGNTWVVGSRFTDYKNGTFKHGRFAEWEILSMDHKLRLELAERLFPELQRLLQYTPKQLQSPATFVMLLEDHPQAAAWGENPLLFSLAATVFLRTGELPASRTMLYREVIDAILKTREANPIWCVILSRLLTQFALWLHRTKGRVFTIDDLVSFLADLQSKSLEETADLAERILRSGMMEPVAHRTFGFRHQTFQEYLASVELAQQLISQDGAVREKAWKLAWSKRTYSRWTEVLRLMVGILYQQPGSRGKQKAQLWLQQLVEQRSMEEGDPGNLGLALVLKSFAEITSVEDWRGTNLSQLQGNITSIWLNELLEAARNHRYTKLLQLQSLARDVVHLRGQEVDKALEQVIKALRSQNKSEREIICEVLRKLGQRVPLQPLLLSLNDPDARIRRATVKSLRGQGDRIPLECLLDALHDENEYVRSAAIEALGEQGDRVPLEHLLEALHDENEEIRSAAVDALGKQGDRVPLEYLLDALHDENEDVRGTVVYVLGEQGDRVPLERLLDALHDKNGDVRGITVHILGKQGDRVPLEYLLDALHDENEDVRRAAVEALGKQGDRVPLEYLLKALHDENSFVRRAAVVALGKQGDRVPLEHLLDALHDNKEDVRRAAVVALGEQEDRVSPEYLFEVLHNNSYKNSCVAAIYVLGEQGDCVSLEHLLKALHDEDEDVRKAAVVALGKQGDRVPLEHLLDALHDNKEDVRGTVIEALGKQGDRVPLEHLLEALHDNNEYVRGTAVEALGKQGDRVPLEHLLEALYDEEEYVRGAAVEALGKQGDRVPLEHLLEALHDKGEYVRGAAVEALGKQGDRVPLEHLLEALHDKEEYVRGAAVEALGKQGDRVPLEHLLEALHDKEEYVRRAAIKALGKQGDRVPLEHFFEALHDNSEYMRAAAVEALGKQGDRVPFEYLLEALYDKEEYVRGAAVEALGKQGDRVPLEHLLEALHDKEEYVRRAAVEALGKQGDRVPLEHLLEALHNKNISIRRAAIKALRKQGDRVQLDHFLEAIGDEYTDVSLEGIKVLSQRAPDIMFRLIDEASVILMRQPASFFLGSISQIFFCQLIGELKLPLPSLLDEVDRLLSWPHWQVRASAAKALGLIHRNIPDTAIRRLLELRCQDPVQVVREAADDALAEILSLETGIEDD